MGTLVGAKAANVSVLMPVKGGKLLFWDGDETFEAPNDGLLVYKIASLSGSARIIECLYRAMSDGEALSRYGMQRKMLHQVVDGGDQDERGAEASSHYGRVNSNQSIQYQSNDVVAHSILCSLNNSQRLAVLTVASTKFQEGFFAIQGPPGCGKTTTMVSMISAIGKGMIVTAPSNAAVANLALKLVKTGRFSYPSVCIFGDGCDESVRFLNPRRRSEGYRRALYEYEQAKSEPCGEAASTQDLKERSRKMDQKRRQLALWLHVDENTTMEKLGSICPNIAVDERGSIMPEGQLAVLQLLSQAKIVLCT